MAIKIQLIEDDSLRADIRKMIEGQLKTIIRSEVERIVREVVEKKIAAVLTGEKISAVAKEVIVRTYYAEDNFKKIAVETINHRYREYFAGKIESIDVEVLVRKMVANELSRMFIGRSNKI